MRTRGTCPVCKKHVEGVRERDIFGCEKRWSTLRAAPHVGLHAERPCEGAGQVVVEERGTWGAG